MIKITKNNNLYQQYIYALTKTSNKEFICTHFDNLYVLLVVHLVVLLQVIYYKYLWSQPSRV